MHDSIIFTVALLVFGFGLLSRRLGHGIVTAPLAFLGFGLLLAPQALGLLGLTSPFEHVDGLQSTIHLLGEITLVIVLFTDATQIDLRALRRQLGLPVRLLSIGLPLTVVLGAALAAPLVPGLGVWELALLGAILAPTDAALGQAVVTSDEVPLDIRQALSAESGLNDGIAVPMVVIFASLSGIGEMVGGEQRTASECLVFATEQVTLGPLAGLLVGAVAVVAMAWAIRREFMEHAYQELAGIAIALLAFTLADSIGGNGFIAAFVAGLVLGNSKREEVCSRLYDFAEAESQLLMLITFLLVGLSLAWPTLSAATPNAWLYAALSLTVIRMLPVALALIGSGLGWQGRLFMGWFGPRGLASILFAILLIEELPVPHAEALVEVVLLTVLLSVVAHGVTAAPLARAYSAKCLENGTASVPAGPTPVRKRHLMGPDEPEQTRR